MKKFFRIFLSLTLICTLLITGTSVLSFASNGKVIAKEDINNIISTQSDTYVTWLNLTTSWKTIAKSTSGFGCNVEIVCNTTGTDGFHPLYADIRMLDKNGNVVWTESKSCPGDGTGRVYFCGSNVYTVQIKVQHSGGTAWASKTSKSAK